MFYEVLATRGILALMVTYECAFIAVWGTVCYRPLDIHFRFLILTSEREMKANPAPSWSP